VHHVGAARMEMPSTVTSCRRFDAWSDGGTGSSTVVGPGTLVPGFAGSPGGPSRSGGQSTAPPQMGGAFGWAGGAGAVRQSPVGYFPLWARMYNASVWMVAERSPPPSRFRSKPQPWVAWMAGGRLVR